MSLIDILRTLKRRLLDKLHTPEKVYIQTPYQFQSLDDYISSPIEIENELLSIFKVNNVLTVFDIGACEGEDSIKYHKLFPEAKVYAFEPRKENVLNATKNFERHHSSTAIQIIEEALSDEIGSATFHLSSGYPDGGAEDSWNRYNKSSSLLEPEIEESKKYWPSLEFNGSIEVKTNTLENFCRVNQIDIVDFIHMDVQGAEMKVLAGAGSYIHHIKAIWMEVEDVALYKGQPLRNEVESFMKKCSFVKIFEQEALANVYGDQLYVNSLFFSDISELKDGGGVPHNFSSD